ncbi:MAG: 2-amino-3-ketobutyrate coenzyme A ligase (EC [uncultured Paraburkholderia sp.]|nr:MAG: 2-amino-3-ketobutyrate coenzyme A ligase (EC [uncultured Paraburkholderia sp.]
MRDPFLAHLRGTLEQIRADGFYKSERVIASRQSADIRLANGQDVLNFCANNYLGLAGDARLIEAAKQGLDADGFGMASVRFICGTQTLHKQPEQALAEFLQTDDCILYSSCFDANGGLFETLLDENDAIISDELNHASIIEGVRLSKAKRFRYKNNDLADLESKLKEADAAGARFNLIATDGVFSMDGIIADLAGICDLADCYGALVMVDDSHAVGFVGEHGRGTPEHCGVLSRVDIITGTLGKALGGASGGYVAARKEIVELLASDEGAQLRARVRENGAHFRSRMRALGFTLVPGEHPIIPVMLGDAQLASKMADALLNEGVCVIGFSFPVVPRGRARIRTQMSAAHTTEQIDRAVDAFARVGRELGVIPAEVA